MIQNQKIVEKYAASVRARDLEATASLLHPDLVVRYPQSGETFEGAETYVSMLRRFPGLPDADVSAAADGKEQVIVGSPFPFGMPVITVVGGGDTFVMEGSAEYSDGGVFNVVAILKLSGGRVKEETWYWAAPFDPPGWRVEPEE